MNETTFKIGDRVIYGSGGYQHTEGIVLKVKDDGWIQVKWSNELTTYVRSKFLKLIE
tara:strand:+ start:414 stop:584 length:171 start_codon:yes stop_codon:yes gene_type:complete